MRNTSSTFRKPEPRPKALDRPPAGMDDALDLLRTSLEAAPLIWRDDYPYVIHPVMDGVPRIDGNVLGAVVDLVEQVVDWSNVDLILGIEAMGLPLCAPLSVNTGMPMVVARKRSYELPGEVTIDQSTGYSNGAMYLNDIKPGERVLIVDDVLSTGGTLRAVIDGIRRCGAVVSEIVVIVEKGEGLRRLMAEEPQVSIKALTALDVEDGRVVTRAPSSMA